MGKAHVLGMVELEPARKTEHKQIPLKKEDILDIKSQAEQACNDYCKELGVGGNHWDQSIFEEAIKQPDIFEQVRRDIEEKQAKYTDNFELSCICEMALLYLESITAVKEEND